jgi:hypothetical protein
MSRALVNQIANQTNNGPVEFPFGLTIPQSTALSLDGSFLASGNTLGNTGQILRAGPNSTLVWADSDTFDLTAGDGTTSNRKNIVLTQVGSGATDTVVLEAGNNVSLSRAGNVITFTSSYVDTDTITNIRTGTDPYVNGDLTLLQGGSTTITQSGSNFTISSTDTQYTAGTGVTLTGTTFSIPQEVDTTSDPTFNDLTLTGNLTAVDGSFTGNVTGTWDGGTIPINKGGTGSTTATSAFIALAPSITNLQDKFLTTDGSNIYWANLPAQGGFTPLEYTLTAEAGPTSSSAKIRSTDNNTSPNFTEVTIVGGTDIAISESGNTITIGYSGTSTTLTQEEVEDIVGGMINNASNTDISVTYNDTAGELEFSYTGAGPTDTNTTYDLSTTAITGGAALLLTPGGSGAGTGVDQIDILGGNNVDVTRDAGTGKLTISALDTNTNTITNLTITGPNTTGGNNFVNGDLVFQASGGITLAQSGTTFAISSSDTNSYVDGASWATLTGALTITRTDTLSDIVVPVDNLQSYFDNRYAQTSNLTDARITSATWNSTSGVLSLLPNNGDPAITVNLDGRYVTDRGDNFYATSGSVVASTNNPGGFHVNRKLLQIDRNDSNSFTVELEPLYDYLDTLYAPITSIDTAVEDFTFIDGELYLSVAEQPGGTIRDQYTYDFDARYVKKNDFVDNLSFNTTNGVLTLDHNRQDPSGTSSDAPSVTVDLDGRYKLDSALDVAISDLIWNPGTGNIYAQKNDNSNTNSRSLDGRYIDTVTLSGNQFTFARNNGTDTVITLPKVRTDVPNNTRMLFYESSAPVGWEKVTSSSLNNAAIRVVTGSGALTGGSQQFSNTFTSNRATGGSVNRGNLDVSGNISSQVNDKSVNKGNLSVNGSPSVNFTSGTGVNRGNLSVSAHTLSTSQMPSHRHNYNYISDSSGNKEFGEKDNDGRTENANTGNTGGGGSHSHGLTGNPTFTGGVSGSKGNLAISGSPSVNFSVSSSHNFNVTGNPTYTAGNMNFAVKYVDVIICRRNDSLDP